MHIRSTLLFVSAIAALLGCVEEPAPPVRPDIRAVTLQGAVAPTPIPPADVVARIDLSGFVGRVSGVAIEPDTGRRLLLLEQGSIVELESGEELWSGVAPQGGSAFGDLVALGDGRVAITSVSDGYLVDLSTGTITPHFCYEPGWWDEPGQDPVQVSQAVAYDAEAGLLYAQPRTIDQGGFGAVTESFVSAYAEADGADVSWWSIDDLGFVATGMAMLEPGRAAGEAQLLLAAERTLYAFDGANAELTPIADLSSLDITAANGIALDREARTLLVIDADAQALVEVRLSALGL
ncbi:MAG: hypothetical protein AB7S26_08405 [Sandaracinaceae bacterium]